VKSNLIPMKTIQIGARTFVEPSVVTHLESEINYTLVHQSNGKRQILSYTLGKVHAKLPAGFVRIHRGCVVNLKFFKKRGKNKMWLKDGYLFIISRRRFEEVEVLIKNFSHNN